MNIWHFIGRIGRDGELRYSPGGDAILSFPVAVDSGYGDKKKTTWPRCTIFGKRAEALAPYIVKGAQVGISGEVTLREYDKDGSTRQSLDVRVSEVTLVGGKGEAQKPAERPVAKPEPAGKPATPAWDDDIPFS